VQSTDAPRDDYERTLCGLWSELLGVAVVGIHDDFFALGGHSLIAVRLFTRLRKIYGVSLGLAVLFQAPTVAGCARMVREALGAAPEPAPSTAAASERPGMALPALPPEVLSRAQCLVPIQPRGDRPPFFLFPGMGGNVLTFQRLTCYLAADQPVLGLQSVGVDGRQQPIMSLPEIATRFIDEIRAVQPHGPYRFGGFSFGGLVAFEAAQQLAAAGERVELLALFDTLLDVKDLVPARAGVRWRRRVDFLRRRLQHHSRSLLEAEAGGRLLGHLRAKSRTLRRRLKSRIWRGAVAVQRTLEIGEEHFELPAYLRSVREANVLAARRYTPTPYHGVITLFRAVDRGLAGPADSDANWQFLARGGLRVVDVPGDHLSILGEPHVQVLGTALDAALRGTLDGWRARSRPDQAGPDVAPAAVQSALAER
jgi:thioesterase domain-containing protein